MPLPGKTKAVATCATSLEPSTESTIELRVGDLYWKQDGPNGWTLGQVTAFDSTHQSASFALIDEQTGEHLCCQNNPVQPVKVHETPLFAANPLFRTAADMTSLRYLHEAALVKNLSDRFDAATPCPYTFMANVLIAVNPLQSLPDPNKLHFMGQALDQCPPHPYNVAENAYRQLCAVRAVMANQSIIISGESGAGKTETSKMILDFLTMRGVHTPTHSTASWTSVSDDEAMDASVPLPPNSLTMALSFPQSSKPQKLAPVAVGERLMETIPILESFGNAKTHRNHNSSRFGKYMRLQFATDSHVLTGASIDTYLLEKSRLVFQPDGERNFHIFYELLHADDTAMLVSALHLTPQSPHLYSYLNQSKCTQSTLLDDAANFRHLQSALRFIGIREETQAAIFRVVAGLLHMGNIHIGHEETDEGETACIHATDEASQRAVRHASELLGVSLDHLVECILHKRIMTHHGARRNSIYYIKRDVRNAVYARDTIAKTIYESTFTWLMGECAAALDYDSFRSDVVPYIGVLDIFGFEDFEPKNRNSFEQLLINYANETLQSLFNACIFQAEQALYTSEHIYHATNHSLSFPFALPTQVLSTTEQANAIDFLSQQVTPSGDVVAYADNRECLNLIASRHGGLFATIDNVSRLPMPSDRKLNERLHTLFKRHPNFPTPHPKDRRDTFLIRHYAGTVSYTITSFVDKNNNILSDQFEELVKNSTSRILQEFSDTSRPHNRARSESIVSAKSLDRSPLGGGTALSKRLKGGSTSNFFSTQMKGLTTELEGTSCNFVRCIKPNTQMEPGVFDRSFVVDQLRCSGTVQACEVLRVGLPTRILYAEVVDVYRHVLPSTVFERFEANDKLLTQAILWAYAFPTSAYRLGDTRLFFRTGKIDLLDRLLTPTPCTTAQLGHHLLVYVRKKRWISATTAIVTFNRWKRVFDHVRYRRRATSIQCMVRQHLARKRVRTLVVQVRMHALWHRMAHHAAILHAYHDRVEDKTVLLQHLLRRDPLSPWQQWLLTWLEPLQRTLFLQKRWQRIRAQYVAQRAFLNLYKSVRRTRSVRLLQSSVRTMLARTRFLKLQKRARARRWWHLAFLRLQIYRVVRQQWQRIHIDHLEKDKVLFATTMATVTTKLHEAQEDAKTAKVQLKEVQVALETVQVQAKQQQERVAELEGALQAKRLEVAELQRQTMGSTLVERLVRFFTCSAAMSPPASPRDLIGPSRVTLLRRETQSASEETFDHGDRIVWATPLSATLLIPQEEGPSALKRRRYAHAKSIEPVIESEEDVGAKDADMLWALSRYMF